MPRFRIPHWSVTFLVFSLLAAAVMSLTIDGPLAKLADAYDRPFWQRVTDLGKAEWVLVPTLVLFLLLLIAGRLVKLAKTKRGLKQLRGIMLFLFSLVALPGLAVMILKQIIGRARPKHLEEFGASYFSSFSGSHSFASMPSGHTATSFLFAFGIAYLWPTWRWPAFAMASLISLSRMIVGAHYPSDIIVGFAFAALCAYGIQHWMANRRKIFQFRDGRIIRRSLAATKKLIR